MFEITYGLDISVDASLSYDQGSLSTSTKNAGQNIGFSWICPEQLSNLCQGIKENNLTFKYSDYQILISNPENFSLLDLELVLKKDKRQANKKFQIKIKNSKTLSKQNTQNGQASSDVDTEDISQMIEINPLTKSSNNEFIFAVNLLDKTMNLYQYSFYWTVMHFTSESQYLNSRREYLIKILSDDLLIGQNNISLQITNPKNNKTYIKDYTYEKPRPPYGGNCQVSPAEGVSLLTTFKFTISNWISKSSQLFYKIKYLNSQNILFDITTNSFTEQEYSSSMLPVSNGFVLEITDFLGLVTQAPCKVKVKRNPNLAELDYYLEREFDPNNKLLLVEIYKSNVAQISGSDSNNSNSNSNAEIGINNKSLDLIDSLMTNSNNSLSMAEQLDKIISLIYDISNKKFDNEKMGIMNSAIENIIINIDPYLEYLDKLKYIYQTLNNLIDKVLKNNSEGLKDNENNIILLQAQLGILNSKLFDKVVVGQEILIENAIYNTQLNKLSSINVNKLNVDYNSSPVEKNKKTRIRILNSSSEDSNPECTELSAFCIPKENMKNLMNKLDSKSIGFQAQLTNVQNNLPITEKQYSNSLEFYLSKEDHELPSTQKTRKKRLLSIEELNMNFEVRLKMPVTKNSTVLGDATCVQYGESNSNNTNNSTGVNSSPHAQTSCESWYDLQTNEVVCSCLKQGLTVNILNGPLSNISKISQFPSLTQGLCKYSKLNINFFFIFIYF